jgi:hypothetical protein
VLYVTGAGACKVAVGKPYHSTGDPIAIGARRATSGAVEGVLDGLVDEVRVYARALAPDDVLALAGR